MAEDYQLYIDGEWTDASSGKTFESTNPATEEVLGTFQQGNEKDIDKAVKAAQGAREEWASTPAPERGRILFKVASILRERKEELAEIATREMGKVMNETRGDVQEAIDMFEYMAGEGRRLYGITTPSELPDKACFTIRRPVGTCGLITPWNFPYAIPAWKIAPALIGGNTVILKPSSDTPLCAVELVKILIEAGVPEGVVNLVTGPGSSAGSRLVKHEDIDMVSFTGHRDTGRWITKNAGLKKVGLEMGGKNPIIVMEDADLDTAVDGIIWGAYGTTGQRCTSASRVIAHEKVKKKLEKKILKRLEDFKVGPGLKKETDMGPLVNTGAVEKSQKYVDIGKDEGAKLLTGGKSRKGKGCFYEPTLFTDVKPDMTIAQEEIFGPITMIIPVKDIDEAIEVANDIQYGLSSSIYTKDVSRAFKAIEKIEAGLTYINSSTIGSEVHLPFGGVKNTGNGTREGGGPSGAVEEFTEVKTVYVDYSGELQKAQKID